MNTTVPAASQARRWLFPTLVGYQRRWLGPDIMAGLTAGAVVIPQAMAYATVADLPVQVGLYTCMVPMLVYVMLGGSRAMSTSTTSTIATLTATTLVSAGVAANSDDAIGSLITLTLLCGLILLALRLLRLGRLVEAISKATVLGVQIGVGVTVAVGQLPKLLGVEAEGAGHGFLRSLQATIDALPGANWPTVALAGGTIAVLLLTRLTPRIPGALIVVAGGIALSAFTTLTDAGVALIEPIPRGLPPVGLPALSDVAALIPGALAIAIMAFLESVAVARALRAPHDPQIDNNQELLAVSLASTIGSFFAALPTAGGFSQSAVNRSAGARSQLAQLVTVILAALVALFLGPVLSLLPQATLAAIVFVAVAGLIDIPQLLRIRRISPFDFWLALATALVGVTAGLLPAVATGVVLTLWVVLRELNTPRLELTARRGDAIVVHIAQGLYTANVTEYAHAVVDLVRAQEPAVAAVVLELNRMESTSLTILDELGELDRQLASTGVTLHLSDIPEASRRVAERTSWYRGLQAEGRVHESARAALEAVAP